MKRREFSSFAVATGALASLPWASAALAQGVPQEGIEYATLAQRVPSETQGKIEVLEFFWYGCPHCNRFEPALEDWAKRLPGDVVLKRVPVAFRDDMVPHQRIYFALEAMNQIEAMHRKVFYAIHVDRNPLANIDQIAPFMAANGLDRARFTEIYNSFAVQTKTVRAKQLSDAYKIDGVPSMGIGGRFFTSGALTGTQERMLVVTNYLVDLIRKGQNPAPPAKKRP